MADEPDHDKARNARFKLLVHEDPENDSLILYVDFRSVHLRLLWRDSQRQDVIDLLQANNAMWFLDRGHLEHEVQKNAAQIDTDLTSLFPEDDTTEESQ